MRISECAVLKESTNLGLPSMANYKKCLHSRHGWAPYPAYWHFPKTCDKEKQPASVLASVELKRALATAGTWNRLEKFTGLEKFTETRALPLSVTTRSVCIIACKGYVYASINSNDACVLVLMSD